MRGPRARAYNWLDGFAFGLLVAVIFGCGFFWLVQSDVRGRFDDYFIAMLTTASAIGAAYLAVLGIGAQIRHAADQEDRRRQDAGSAAVALLPIALAEMSEAATLNIRRHFDPKDLYPPHPHQHEMAKFSLEALGVLKTCIEYSDERTRSELLYLIRAYQVLDAREPVVNTKGKIRKAPAGNLSEFGRIGDAIAWAEVHATIDNLFVYARSTHGSVAPFEPVAVWTSLSLAGVVEDEFPNVKAVFDKRAIEQRLRFNFAPR